jgi:hypothetical protein
MSAISPRSAQVLLGELRKSVSVIPPLEPEFGPAYNEKAVRGKKHLRLVAREAEHTATWSAGSRSTKSRTSGVIALGCLLLAIAA